MGGSNKKKFQKSMSYKRDLEEQLEACKVDKDK